MCCLGMHGDLDVLVWVSFMSTLSVSGCVLGVWLLVCILFCGHLINAMDIVSCVGMSMFVYIMCICVIGEYYM